MATPTTDRLAHLVDPQQTETVDVLGPTVAFLVGPEDDAPCVMRGTIPPRGIVPMHSHADPETFIAITGELEGLVMAPDGHRWVPITAGDVFHIPGHVPHAWRNPADRPVVTHIVSTPRIGRFFREVGTPVAPGADPSTVPPTTEQLQRFLRVAERYGYWNATPEENARIGLLMPPAG
jgi:quercetin dioxygenase-like cupin family protein